MNDLVDLTKVIAFKYEMPLCPLCDQEITHNEPRNEFIAYGVVGLAHLSCINVARKNLEDIYVG